MFYVPFASKSIKITFMPVASELVKRGHEVYVVMPFDDKAPGVKVINVDPEAKTEEVLTKLSVDKLKGTGDQSTPIFDILDLSFALSETALTHPEMKKLLAKADTKFDVILVSVFLGNEAGYYLAHRWNASLVLYSTAQSGLPWVDTAMGQPHNPSYTPLPLTPYSTDMTFLQRVVNTVTTFVFEHALRNWYILSRVEDMLDKHFPGVSRPPLIDIEKNSSLTISFGHPLLMDGWKPMSPNYITVGMMNCREPKAFPKGDKIGDFLASASNGVVFVSFGSVFKASQMSDGNRKLLLNVFASFPKVKFLWKWETETMADKPDNLMLSKWLPQQDVLGHPNVKLFITHAGQSSFQETICHQTPVVAMPVSGDQPANAMESERLGLGINVPFHEATEESLHNAIDRTLNDPKYATTAKDLGSAMADQINKPLDRTIWWLEHLMRHPNQYKGKSPVHKLAWYQYFLLDVIAFIVVVVLVVIVIIKKLIFAVCCRSKKTKRD